MGTNYAPIVADLYIFCHERDLRLPPSDNNQADGCQGLKRIENFWMTSPPELLTQILSDFTPAFLLKLSTYFVQKGYSPQKRNSRHG